ncbi:MAG: NAD(+) synthase [Bacilli bacterium]|nr:NAD(+) synthase [Bacilli bacterium]
MLKEYGYVRVGACSSKISVSNVNANVDEIIVNLEKLNKEGVEIVCFSELSLTGYTCKDLFFTSDLLKASLNGLNILKEESKKYDLVFVVGVPLKINARLYNCAVTIFKGEYLGVTAKRYLNSDELRYFESGNNLEDTYITLNGESVLVSNNILYKASEYDYVRFNVSVGNDFMHVNNSDSNLVLALTSNIALINNQDFYHDTINNLTEVNSSCYVYANGGASETSSDVILSNQLIISDVDEVINDIDLSFESKYIYHDVDLLRIENKKLKGIRKDNEYNEVVFDLNKKENKLLKKYNKTPFIVSEKEMEEVMNILSFGLARRVKQLGNSKMIIGISGGSDSTLAMLVCLRATKILNISNENIVCVTMPGFGTSNKTYTNSVNLIKEMGATFKEISIKDACIQHYKDIGHKEDNYDITYENAQARERTQILFDLANELNGFVVGTGDLSECVLGWATYNGDHMSNYAVNGNIPKTMVKSLIRYESNKYDGVFKETLESILDTIISPELLPLDAKGNIAQSSEVSLKGSYTLHDFFIYHFLGYNAGVKKLYYLAVNTFEEYSKEEIKEALTTFIKRFFIQQFKRTCSPDGIRVNDIDICVRGDLRLNSDLSYKLYLSELEEL